MTKRLLIIDKDSFDKNIMIKLFGSKYKICFTDTPDKADLAYAQFMPDVIYYEMRSMDVDGLQIVCGICNILDKQIPLIVAVSYNTPELEQLARVNGVFYYLIRPFNLKELWDALEAAFQHVERKNLFPVNVSRHSRAV